MADSSFADWLNDLMTAHFISSSYLARSIGCTQVAVNRWRAARGFPDGENRERLAAFFGLTVAELPALPPPVRAAKPKAARLEGRVFR